MPIHRDIISVSPLHEAFAPSQMNTIFRSHLHEAVMPTQKDIILPSPLREASTTGHQYDPFLPNSQIETPVISPHLVGTSSDAERREPTDTYLSSQGWMNDIRINEIPQLLRKLSIPFIYQPSVVQEADLNPLDFMKTKQMVSDRRNYNYVTPRKAFVLDSPPNPLEFYPPFTNIFSGKETISPLPYGATTTEELPKELIFHASIFKIREEKENFHQDKVNYLIKIAGRNSPNRLLLIDDSKPLEAWEIFSQIPSSLQNSSNTYKQKVRISPVSSNSRRNFKNKSIQIMLKQKQAWLNYWINEFGIQEEYENLKALEPFSLKYIQNYFLAWIFHVNMIISVFVDKRNPEWEIENQARKLSIVKNAAKNFQSYLEKSLSPYILKGLGSCMNLKYSPFKVTWILMPKWIQMEESYWTDYKTLSDCMDLLPDFFEDVFGYSIVSLNQIISNLYKKV
jgi:hypothetical protein